MSIKFTEKRYDFLKKEASNLLSMTKNNNPFYIAVLLKIDCIICKLNENLPSFLFDNVIYINQALDDYSKRIVCAHELGHFILHKQTNAFELFYAGEENITEFEANLFVKEIMPQVFAKQDINDFEYISDFNKYVESKIRFIK